MTPAEDTTIAAPCPACEPAPLSSMEAAQEIANITAENERLNDALDAAISARAESAEASLARMMEALTPSAETKAAYIGEFSFTFPIAYADENGEPQEEQRRVNVPWTTIKKIMKAISARANVSQSVGVSQAARDVLAERRRQVEAEGFSYEHDSSYGSGPALAHAASCYALMGGETDAFRKHHDYGNPPSWWPWPERWWKPKDRRRDLVRAGALILAEIERLDRLSPPGGA